MRVNLKGIASTTKVLATGEKVTYYYAWRGGPRLGGEPNSEEFIQSYERARRDRRAPDASVFKSVIADYLASDDFGGLRDRTKSDYQKHIASIERSFGNLPMAALTDPKVTGEFLRWRDGIAGRQGDYAWSVLMAILTHGRTVGLHSYKPPARIKKLYHADRSEIVWEAHHIERFMAVASEPLKWALIFAVETGARQGDILRMPWSAIVGGCLEFTPSKTVTRIKPKGRRARVPASDLLRAMIEKLPRVCPIMLTNGRGRPWQPNVFRKAWGSAATKAGLSGLHFHDLRGTAVTRWSDAGRTPKQIAGYTGWSMRDVYRILDAYLKRSENTDSITLERATR
jgi:integrase